MKILKTLSICALALTAVSTAANAGTLENMERERALLVETVLDGALTPAQRQEKVSTINRRLVDLERMVLRDKSLTGKNTPVVRKAFANYDLTFLVHAATEHGMTVPDHWLEQVGISTESLMAARTGKRY